VLQRAAVYATDSVAQTVESLLATATTCKRVEFSNLLPAEGGDGGLGGGGVAREGGEGGRGTDDDDNRKEGIDERGGRETEVGGGEGGRWSHVYIKREFSVCVSVVLIFFWSLSYVSFTPVRTITAIFRMRD